MGVAIGGERLGPAPGAIQGEHLLAAQPLAQRMLAHERVELGERLGVPAAGEVRVDAVAHAGEAEVLQPRDLRLREAGARHVRERGAAPERERLAKCRGRLPRLAGGELGAPAANEPLEAGGVELARRHLERVAAAVRAQRAVAERAAQPRRHDVDGLAAVRRAVALPERVERSVDVHDRAAMDQEQGEQRERPAARHAPVVAHLDRAEDPEPGLHHARRTSRHPDFFPDRVKAI